MNDSPTILTELRAKLPVNVHNWAGDISHILDQLKRHEITPTEAQLRINNEPALTAAFSLLAGETIKTTNELITFGQGNNFGSISFGDIAGGNITRIERLEVTYTVHPSPDLTLRKFYDCYVQAYNDAKKIRRLLRADAQMNISDAKQGDEVMIKRDVYKMYAHKLNEVQIQFETLIAQFDSNTRLFSNLNDTSKFRSDLKKMEKYLGQIFGEYEGSFQLSHDLALIPASQLPILREFIQKASNMGKFKTIFTNSASSIKRSLQQLLNAE